MGLTWDTYDCNKSVEDTSPLRMLVREVLGKAKDKKALINKKGNFFGSR